MRAELRLHNRERAVTVAVGRGLLRGPFCLCLLLFSPSRLDSSRTSFLAGLLLTSVQTPLTLAQQQEPTPLGTPEQSKSALGDPHRLTQTMSLQL